MEVLAVLSVCISILFIYFSCTSCIRLVYFKNKDNNIIVAVPVYSINNEEIVNVSSVAV